MTPAISELENAGFEYELLNYHYDPSVGSYGTDAASKLGLNSEAVFKTLMSELFSPALGYLNLYRLILK